MPSDVTIRPLTESDLDAADRVTRLAFGTFLGLPDPMAFAGDADYVRPRWRSDPTAAWVADEGGDVVGLNMATNWGSVSFFGPLTVHPERWDQGVGKRLLGPVMDRFALWGTRHAGLFTFAHSPKHLGLYRGFGFRPRFLTAIMSKAVSPQTAQASGIRLSDLPEAERDAAIRACREVTDAIYEGLELSREIGSLESQRLGDTVLVTGDSGIAGFAICHAGKGTEAGSSRCYVKFAAVLPGPAAGRDFARLLEACECAAAERGAATIVAGQSHAREEAYGAMLEHGYRADFVGVCMHRPNEPGYHRPGVYAIDDWR